MKFGRAIAPFLPLYLALLASGCGNVCQPGSTQLCWCAPGAQGIQICNNSGSFWEPCSCQAGADGGLEDGGTSLDEDGGPVEDGGPAEDGGYVLVGARRSRSGAVCREMFEHIPWGSDSVYADTRARLRQLGRQWAELPVLADIDRPADLPRWRALQARRCR